MDNEPKPQQEGERRARLMNVRDQARVIMTTDSDPKSRYEGYRQYVTATEELGDVALEGVPTKKGLETLSAEEYAAWEVKNAQEAEDARVRYEAAQQEIRAASDSAEERDRKNAEMLLRGMATTDIDPTQAIVPPKAKKPWWKW